MGINVKKANISLAATAAMLLSACSSTDNVTSNKVNSDDKGKCIGANACKGRSACASQSNACAGQNACKGKGFITTSKTQCEAANGNWDNETN